MATSEVGVYLANSQLFKSASKFKTTSFSTSLSESNSVIFYFENSEVTIANLAFK